MTRLPLRAAAAALLLAGSAMIGAAAETKSTMMKTSDAPDRMRGGSAEIGALAVEAAWTRQAPPGAKVGGGYARITNRGTEADRLIGGSVPFAERVEIHEMRVADGVMTMREITGGLVIAPGETVELLPGGPHLMFVGLSEAPVQGTTATVTLRFERAGEVAVDMPVAAIGATSPGGARDGADMSHSGLDGSTRGHGDGTKEAAR